MLVLLFADPSMVVEDAQQRQQEQHAETSNNTATSSLQPSSLMGYVWTGIKSLFSSRS